MSTVTTTSAHPVPAMRVGGRRMSLPSRPKPVLHPHPAPSPAHEAPDYPRPLPPGAEHDQEHEHMRGEDEQERPRREKRYGHGAHENDLRARENAARRAEANAPKNGQTFGGKLAFGSGGRISQPAGKTFV